MAAGFIDGNVSSSGGDISAHIASTGNGSHIPSGGVSAAEIADSAVTDAKIGNRTAVPTAPTNLGPGLLTSWLNWIVERIKSILGTANWHDAVPTTLTATAAHIASAANPHGVTAAQIGAAATSTTIALNPGSGMSGGGSVNLGAGGTVTLTNADRGSDQLLFRFIADSLGTLQFSAATNGDTLRFASSGSASVSFDAATKKITFSATDTTYSSGDGLSLTGTTFAVNSTVVRTTGTQSIGGNKTFGGDVVVAGNLTVQGTQTIIDATNVSFQDVIVQIARNNDGSAPFAGIQVERGSEDAWALWDESSDRWGFYRGADTGNLTLVPVVASAFVGALQGNADTAAKWQVSRTISVSGAVSGSASGVDGSGNVSITTTLATVPPTSGGTGLTSIPVDKILYTSSINTFTTADISATGRTLISSADAAAARSAVGAQASSSELTAIAGLSATGFLQRLGSGSYQAANPQFSQISGSLTASQLPGLTSRNLWLGDASNAAVATPLTSIIARGTLASRPAASANTAGMLWIDSATEAPYYSTGSAWIAIGGTSSGSNNLTLDDHLLNAATGRYASATANGGTLDGFWFWPTEAILSSSNWENLILPNRVGFIRLNITNQASSRAAIIWAGTLNMRSGLNTVFKSDIYIPTLAATGDDFSAIVGHFDQASLDFPDDGCYFSYNKNNSLYWQCISCNNGNAISSQRTTVTTSALVQPETWTDFEIRLNGTSSADFYINGSLVASITTNLPGTDRLFYPQTRISRFATDLGTSSRQAVIDKVYLKFEFI